MSNDLIQKYENEIKFHEEQKENSFETNTLKDIDLNLFTQKYLSNEVEIKSISEIESMTSEEKILVN